MGPKCDECPVLGGAACLGQQLSRRCGQAEYRGLFGRIARGEMADPVAAPATPRASAASRASARPPGPDLLANARDCPHREKIPDDEREGCGCSHRCESGYSRKPNGGVTVLECWSCPIAPRLARPLP